MGKADLHAHTCHNIWCDGNQTVEELFQWVEEETDLDLFGITDHDNVAAARQGYELHQKGRFRFGYLSGVEVTNQSGHLLCYFPKGNIVDIPSLRPFWWTVEYARARGAICIAAHPVFPPWLAPTLRHGLRRGRHLDGIEAVNAGIGHKAQNRLDSISAMFDSQLAVVGNSDAHQRNSIGAAYTEFPGRTMDDFLRALENQTTRPILRRRPVLERSSQRHTRRRSMTSPGWVGNLWRELTSDEKTPARAETE
jgi:predicted metal-dependent phosphoesterase TrpH